MIPGSRTFAIACIFVAAYVSCMRAAESSAPDVKSAGNVIAAEFEKLSSDYDRLWKKEIRAHTDAEDAAEHPHENLSDDEWLKKDRAAVDKTPNPDSVMLPRFLAFAKRHLDSPLALDALFIVIRRGGNQTGEVYGKPWQTKEEALELDWTRQLNDPRVIYVFEQLGGSIPSHETEAFLRTALAKAPTRTVAAAAAFHLASYYHSLAHIHDVCQKAKNKPHPTSFDRYWKLVLAPYVEKDFPIDNEKNSTEVQRLLTLVVDKYADVSADKWQHTGPYRTLLRPQPYPHPKTYGDLANSMLFELNNIVPGKQAPDIAGTDADGKRFRLSDYRGKVVLLTFSANWCGSCVELYPIERSIVKKFRDKPFVLLSVNEDEKVETLRASSASGEITWRCWWDGKDGLIRNAWNRRGVPYVFLLDHEQIIQDGITRLSSQQEFEQAIAALLKKIPESKTSSK